MKIKKIDSLREIRKLLQEGMKIYCESALTFNDSIKKIDEIMKENNVTDTNSIIYLKDGDNIIPADQTIYMSFHTPQTIALIPSNLKTENSETQMTIQIFKDIINGFKNKFQLKIRINEKDKNVDTIQYDNINNTIIFVTE